LPGEAYAIVCAFLWALSSALLKSQVHKIHPVSLGALRTLPALALYWGLMLFSGRMHELFQLPLQVWGFLAGSTLVGMVVGDLLYFRSMSLIGLSRAMPLSMTYPFFTLLLALLFLKEQLGWLVVTGALLITGGAYLLAFPRGVGRIRHSEAAQKADLVGVALACVAAICWAGSTIMLRIGLSGVDVALANSVRLPVLMAVLSVMLVGQGKVTLIKGYGLRSLGIVFLSGIIGMGLGTYTFLAAIQSAGAAKTSILSAITPLFGVPFSLVLREKLSTRALVGTALTMAGVLLTIS
jgi:DME family drug/metabolite transporter